MNKDQIEKLLIKNYSKLNELNLNPIFRVIESSSNLFQIEIILNSNIIVHSFNLDFSIKSSYNGKLELPNGFQNKGWGKLLVQSREKLCKDLKIRFIIINNCENSSFWQKMNYKLVTNQMYDYFNKNNPQIFMDEQNYQPSRYKEIV